MNRIHIHYVATHGPYWGGYWQPLFGPRSMVVISMN